MNCGSRNSSPNSSPRTLGRNKGRLRLPQLGSKHKLSSSKDNLDSCKDPGTDLEQTLSSDQSETVCNLNILGNSQADVSIAQGNELTLANGFICDQKPCSNILTETCLDKVCIVDQRDTVSSKSIYNLYAISCHSGILGGGHYVTYAKNPNDKWYCYNDSSCKELHPDEIDTDSAYILFYEQQEVDYAQFLPKIDGKKMADTSSMDEDFESDYKKYCVIQ